MTWTNETIENEVPMGLLLNQALVEGTRTLNEPNTPDSK
jgi:hypothetical protein